MKVVLKAVLRAVEKVDMLAAWTAALRAVSKDIERVVPLVAHLAGRLVVRWVALSAAILVVRWVPYLVVCLAVSKVY